MTFREGDRVRRTYGGNNGMNVGDEDIVVRHIEGSTSVLLKKYGEGHSVGNLTLVTPAPISKQNLKSPTHVVIWDEQARDPHKFFISADEAKEFIKTLTEKSEVKKDSVVLVEIKSCKKVNIKKRLEYSEYKTC